MKYLVSKNFTFKKEEDILQLIIKADMHPNDYYENEDDDEDDEDDEDENNEEIINVMMNHFPCEEEILKVLPLPKPISYIEYLEKNRLHLFNTSLMRIISKIDNEKLITPIFKGNTFFHLIFR